MRVDRMDRLLEDLEAQARLLVVQVRHLKALLPASPTHSS
jgi:hypothetical protein